jgi:hypothetical protein
MELKMETNTGKLKIHGEMVGVRVATLDYRELIAHLQEDSAWLQQLPHIQFFEVTV